MKIAITGASGLLGKYLLQTQPLLADVPEGGHQYIHQVIGCYKDHPIPNGVKLDVSNREEVIYKLFEIRPDIIIHCAANGNVDDVENNPAEAVKSDLLGTINLLDFCDKIGTKLITISSNAVYSGNNPPYDESSPRNPINLYGRIKSLADDIVMKSPCEWMIIRPIMLYGWNYKWGRGNWVTKILDMAKANKVTRLVDDSFTQPTYAFDVANLIWSFIKGNDMWGQVVNLSSKERVNLYQFGLKICETWGVGGFIESAKTSDFPSIAPRPIDTTFNFNWRLATMKEGLKEMKNEHS